MKIRVIHVGKISPLLKEAVGLYEKRVSNYETLEIIEVRQAKKLPRDKTIKKEGENILAILDDEETVVALTEEGSRFSSIGFAKWFADARIANQPLAFVVGAISGLYLMNYFSSNVMMQVEDSILPFFSTAYGEPAFSASFGTIVANIVVVAGTFTGLIYFFFSKEHKGAFGGAAKIGIWVIMVTFGASFGYTVMSRMSLLIGRMDFIFGDWLGMIK